MGKATVITTTAFFHSVQVGSTHPVKFFQHRVHCLLVLAMCLLSFWKWVLSDTSFTNTVAILCFHETQHMLCHRLKLYRGQRMDEASSNRHYWYRGPQFWYGLVWHHHVIFKTFLPKLFCHRDKMLMMINLLKLINRWCHGYKPDSRATYVSCCSLGFFCPVKLHGTHKTD